MNKAQEKVLARAIDRCRERGVILPTFKQLADPSSVPAGIKSALKTVGLNDLNPLNLFRITWHNEPVESDGGFGGANTPRPRMPGPPDREPDIVCDLPTLPQAALIYRLCGDMNPLHADPRIAAKAGFERPILHGRCTMGVAMHALLRSCCDYEADRLQSMQVRFSAPFLPGDTLRTEIWREGEITFFRSSSLERGVTVLSNGSARIAN